MYEKSQSYLNWMLLSEAEEPFNASLEVQSQSYLNWMLLSEYLGQLLHISTYLCRSPTLTGCSSRRHKRK